MINYKLSEFLQIKDEKLIQDYLVFLEHLNPLREINNPKNKWYTKIKSKFQKKTKDKITAKIKIKAVRELSFSDVTTIRDLFNESSNDSILQAVKMVSGLEDKHIINFTILEFYGIISYIKSELNDITNMELNGLADDETYDINLEKVNAKARMGRFGTLNTIDSLAKEDVLRWEAINNLPYMTVFTKLMMDNTKNKIQAEIAELQRKKQNK